MEVSKLIIRNFRGIFSTELFFSNHVVLIGDNNTGKSTIFEALDLTLGPDRVNRRPIIDEHDFYNSKYLSNEEENDNPKIFIEAIVTNLSIEQQSHFKDYLEWWNMDEKSLHTLTPPNSIDKNNILASLRVCFIGEYDEEEDDFVGGTYFSRSFEEN